jgi:hypothetical protein
MSKANLPSKKALIDDLQRVKKEFPKANITRDFYRIQGSFSEAAWHKHFSTFKDFVAEAGLTPSKAEIVTDPRDVITVDELIVDIKKLLKRRPLKPEDISAALGFDLGSIDKALNQMQAQGVMLHSHVDGTLDLLGPSLLPTQKSHHAFEDRGDGWQVFGWTSDNHLCNRHSRLDVLEAAYDRFEAEGVKVVFNGGNWIDGEKYFNKTELIVAPGMDPQINYMIDKWPVRKNIVTKFIAGDDHEGWYSQRENIEIGKYLELQAQDQGRDDLIYLGYAEADVELRTDNGSAVMRVVHPGGGSSYALSYTSQKLVEAYQGGEKPQVLLVGHYHKFDWCYPREVQVVQLGCTCDQTLFMRKNKLQAAVGYGIIKLQQDKDDGHITRFCVEWFPFYDRGFYEKRFS